MGTLDRFQFEALVAEVGVTKSVLAHIAGVWKTDVTDFTKGRRVSDEKVQRMTTALLELRAWRKSLQFAPSMTDADAVREAVGAFRIESIKKYGARAAFDYLSQPETPAALETLDTR